MWSLKSFSSLKVKVIWDLISGMDLTRFENIAGLLREILPVEMRSGLEKIMR